MSVSHQLGLPANFVLQRISSHCLDNLDHNQNTPAIWRTLLDPHATQAKLKQPQGAEN